MNTEKPTTNVAVGGTGRRDWGYTYTATPEMGSPPCTQPRAIIDKDVADEETQEMELSFQSTQQQTRATEIPMWSEFTTTVRDWFPPSPGASRREQGWFCAKKGRWDLTDYGSENAGTAMALTAGEPAPIDLNFLLQNQTTTATTREGDEVAPIMCIAAPSKSGGSGNWRGTARGRRPPAAQPRYHTTVRLNI